MFGCRRERGEQVGLITFLHSLQIDEKWAKHLLFCRFFPLGNFYLIFNWTKLLLNMTKTLSFSSLSIMQNHLYNLLFSYIFFSTHHIFSFLLNPTMHKWCIECLNVRWTYTPYPINKLHYKLMWFWGLKVIPNLQSFSLLPSYIYINRFMANLFWTPFVFSGKRGMVYAVIFSAFLKIL